VPTGESNSRHLADGPGALVRRAASPSIVRASWCLRLEGAYVPDKFCETLARRREPASAKLTSHLPAMTEEAKPSKLQRQ
jgi:hypothetical protein